MSISAHSVAVIGGGPAGLMAAEVLCSRGHAVDLYDAMPSLGRKFLMAGKSGLNLTHAEPYADFATRFSPANPVLAEIVGSFPPEDIRAWATGLGIETFTGTSGRVFPAEMKAAPLLRAWLRKLRDQGLRVHVRHRWTGWSADGGLQFEPPAGSLSVRPTITLLALGGASWPRLGSDGAWVDRLAARGVEIAPFRPSNCGFDVDWSEHLRSRHQGQPLKGIAIRFGGRAARGDCMVTDTGLEGGPLYTLSSPIVDAIAQSGAATVHLDLAPDLDETVIIQRLAKAGSKTSLSNRLRKGAGLTQAKAGLVYETTDNTTRNDPAALAAAIKSTPIIFRRPRPIAEAISSAGGVSWSALSSGLEVKALPGTFVAGEMLDWDAPTGGYLLSGCLASGRWAGEAMAQRLAYNSVGQAAPPHS